MQIPPTGSDWETVIRQKILAGVREASISDDARNPSLSGDPRALRVLGPMWPEVSSIRYWAAILGMGSEETEAILAICRGRTRKLRLNRRLQTSQGRAKRSSRKCS